MTGIGPAALGAFAGLTTLAEATATVAGAVAYRGNPSPGKPPQWYTKTDNDRRVHEALYSPGQHGLKAGSAPLSSST